MPRALPSHGSVQSTEPETRIAAFCAANTPSTQISKLARRSGILQTFARTLRPGDDLNGLIHPGRLWEGWLKHVRNIMAADKEVETDDVSPGSMVLETETQ